MYRKIIFLSIFFIFLAGCTSHYVYPERTYSKIENVKLPKWVWELPQNGEFVVGISQKSDNKERMISAAKEMATVIHSRNNASIAISKDAYINDDFASMKINVSAFPDSLRQLCNSLKLIASAYLFNNYFIGLFSTKMQSVDSSYFNNSEINPPSWFNNGSIKIEKNFIYIYTSQSSSDLITAWENAASNARIELVKYLINEVQGMEKMTYTNFDKIISIVSKKMVGNMSISRAFITSQTKDSLLSYKVYLEIKIKKK